LEPTSGEVLRNSRLIIGRYDQHFEELLPFHMTPVEYLLDQFQVTTAEARKYLGTITLLYPHYISRRDESAGMFGLDGARHLIRIEQLSGGQKARCVFAGLALRKPHLLVLDEPTNHLDVESVDALIKALELFTGGVVLVSHDARLISALKCELWVCGDSDRGLRVERRGFGRYRADVLADLRRREARAERKAQERALMRKARRDHTLSQHSIMRGPPSNAISSDIVPNNTIFRAMKRGS
jgi:ATP-binding cassette, subfamily F, member 1